MIRLLLILTILTSACTPINTDNPHNRAIVAAILGASLYHLPTTQPRDCYATGNHAGVIATCY